MKVSPKVKAGCGVITVFALGFFLGAMALLFVIVRVVPLAEGWRSEKSKEFIAEHLSKQLKLNDSQRAEFEPIIRDVLEKRWALRRDYLLEDMEMLEQELVTRVDPILTEPQREKARKMLERWRRDHRFKIVDPKKDAAPADSGDSERLTIPETNS